MYMYFDLNKWCTKGANTYLWKSNSINAHYKSVLFVGCLFANVCRQARADTCTLTKVHTKTNMHTNKLTEKHIKITQIYTCTKSSKTDKITHEHEHTNIQTHKNYQTCKMHVILSHEIYTYKHYKRENNFFRKEMHYLGVLKNHTLDNGI